MSSSVLIYLAASVAVFIVSTVLFLILSRASQRGEGFGGDGGISQQYHRAARPSLATLSLLVSVLSLISSTVLGILALLKH
jgi:hypothetical protein